MCDSRSKQFQLATNHSAPNWVVDIGDNTAVSTPANHVVEDGTDDRIPESSSRPARLKRRPVWLEEFSAKLIRSTGDDGARCLLAAEPSGRRLHLRIIAKVFRSHRVFL